MTTIRTATAGDAALLARLNREVQDLHISAEPDLYATPDAADVEAWFHGQLGAPDARVLIAEAEDAAGYAVVRIIDWAGHVFARPRRIALVDQIAVGAAFRRRGVGRALMEAAERLARDEACAEIQLDVRAFNGDALGFYQALGYRPVTHRLTRPLR